MRTTQRQLNIQRGWKRNPASGWFRNPRIPGIPTVRFYLIWSLDPLATAASRPAQCCRVGNADTAGTGIAHAFRPGHSRKVRGRVASGKNLALLHCVKVKGITESRLSLPWRRKLRCSMMRLSALAPPAAGKALVNQKFPRG
ncbi:hypothetical protein GCM10023166_03820 [Paeniglutamicibacter cryotolerans]